MDIQMTNENDTRFKTSRERLRFFVNYANADLSSYQPAEWNRLWRDLWACLTDGRPQEGWVKDVEPGAFWIHLDHSQLPTRVEDQKVLLRKGQRDVVALFREIVIETKTPRSIASSSPGSRIIDKAPTFARALTFPSLRYVPVGIPGEPESFGVQVRGQGSDLIRYKALHAVSTAYRRPLGECPRCGAFVYRFRTQKFCSRACLQQAGYAEESLERRNRRREKNREDAARYRLKKAKAKRRNR